MLKIALADDNEEILQIVQREIENCIKVPVVTQAYTQSELLLFDVNEGKEYDVYFLDIDMPELNGLDLAKRIREMQKKPIIIFLTSYPDFALASYDIKIRAYQYILKHKMKETLPAVMRSIVAEINEPRYYTIQTQVRFSRISCDDVLYMRKDGKNVIIVTTTREYRERKTLDKIVKDMNLPELIFIERGYVVNILHIQHIKNNVIIMDNGENLFISRNKISAVKEKVNEYWSNVL